MLTVLKNRSFLPHFLSFLFFNLADWLSIALTPIWVAEKFGSGSEIVLSLGLRLLPQIVLAPIMGIIINKFKPSIIAGVTLLLVAPLFSLIIKIDHFDDLKMMLIILGLLEAFIWPSFFTLRSMVVPKKHRLEANALLQGNVRASRLMAPAMAGFIIFKFGFTACVTLIFILFSLAGLLTIFTSTKTDPKNSHQLNQSFSLKSIVKNLKIFYHYVFIEKFTRAATFPSYTYFITLGIMRPFLFWYALSIGLRKEGWTVFLSAHGLGAILGVFVISKLLKSRIKKYNEFQYFYWSCLLEGTLLIPILFIDNVYLAALIFFASGIPEMIAGAAYFSIIQNKIHLKDQPAFFSISVPLFDGFFAIGIFIAGLYSEQILSLNALWVLALALAIFPIIPFHNLSKEYDLKS